MSNNVYIEISGEVKYDEISARRILDQPNYGSVTIPVEGINIVIEGSPRDIYRTLLNAADRIRNEHSAIGLGFGFDRPGDPR